MLLYLLEIVRKEAGAMGEEKEGGGRRRRKFFIQTLDQSQENLVQSIQEKETGKNSAVWK